MEVANMLINLWQLFQKISGLVFSNPNIPALKYVRYIEENSVNEFFNIKSKEHKDFKLPDCDLFLDNAKPFIGKNPDLIISSSCCPRACQMSNVLIIFCHCHLKIQTFLYHTYKMLMEN